MLKHRAIQVIALTTLLAAAWTAETFAGHRIGGGVHYLRNLGDIKEQGYEPNSFSLLGSYQYAGSLLKFEGDVEYIFDFAGTDEPMWQPSAWLLAGGAIYGGAGIGIGYIDGDWQNDPFYAIRAGVELAFATLDIDLFATYRFQSDPDLEKLTGEDLDSVTFAAVLRFGP